MYLPDVFRVIYYILLSFAVLFVPRAIDWRNKPQPDTARLVTLALILSILSNVAVSLEHWGKPLIPYGTPLGLLAVISADAYVIAVWKERHRH